jgi:tetratricopeptide (TPR) repeat protein
LGNVNTLFSQDLDDLDDLEGDAQPQVINCEPDSFSTPWEYLGKDTLTMQQIAIKFSYLKDYAKKQNWEKVRKYGWELVYGDKKRKFKSVYDKLADSYFYTNQLDSTLLVCQMGLKDVGDRTRLHYYAAYIQFKLGRYACAEKHYKKLLDKKPNEISYWKPYTQCLIKQNKEEAIKAQEKVVELTNNDQKEQTLLAQLYDKYGLNALDAYVQSWKSKPVKENISSAEKVSQMALQQGQEALGIEIAQEALKLDPKNKNLLRNIAELYHSNMNYGNAIKYYKKYMSVDGENVDALCAISDIYREKKDWQSARNYARKAMKLDSKSGKPHIALANVYQTAATECLNTVLEGKPTIDVKLVFKYAYDEYGKAAKDPAYAAEAKAKRKWLKSSQLIPTKEDTFLHPNVKKPRGKCFSWI